MENKTGKSVRVNKTINQRFKLLFLAILLFAFFGLAKTASASTAFYVDPTAGSGGNGSYASPWNSLSQVNGHSFSTGDDVYFKAGTTLNVPAGQYLDVDWNGTAGDHVVIGAYYGNGLFGLNGVERPILEANNGDASMTELGIITKWGGKYPNRIDAYADVKDIRINRPYGYAIIGMDVNYYTVRNCFVWHPAHPGGITVTRSQYIVFDGNTIDASGWSSVQSGGLMAVGQDGSNHTVMSNNIVTGLATEGIDSYHMGNDCEIYGNIVYDTGNVGIYIDRASYTDIHDNIVYTSNADIYPGHKHPWAGIAIDNELQAGFCNNVGHNAISNNYVANCSIGLMLSSENQDCVNQFDSFYDNILADNEYSFRFWGGTPLGHDNDIYNNIAYTSNNSTMFQADDYSSHGVIWGANIFDDAVSGNASAKACTVASPLAKTSGWNNLTAGSVSASTFALSSSGSAGKTSCFGGDTTPPAAPTGLRVD